MNIQTITCHDVYNYGASLQAYALQTYCKALGYDYSIIDYKPDYIDRTYNFWYVDKSSRFYPMCQKFKLFHLIYCLRLAPITYKTWTRKVPFDKFKRKYLTCTRRYNSLRELQSCPPQGEIYIAGSDQIWNCCLLNGRDNAFFLDFGSSSTKRISYAASLGIPYFPEEEKLRIKHLLERFCHISVRETSGVFAINNLGFDCLQVCDPVFLLDKQQWLNIIPNKTVNKKFILVYDIFADDNRIKNAARIKAEETGLPIYAINDVHKCMYADKNISDAGPLEFLYYIYNAEFVLSNSFHATAFAVLFNKQFATFYNKKNSSRMTDFLEAIGLMDCYNPSVLPSINNWGRINQHVEHFVSDSKKFIIDSLSS